MGGLPFQRDNAKSKAFLERDTKKRWAYNPCFILNLSVFLNWVKLAINPQDLQDFVVTKLDLMKNVCTR